MSKKISELSKKMTAVIAGDMLVVNEQGDGDAYTTKQVDVEDVKEYVLGEDVTIGGNTDGDIVTIDGEQRLSMKELISPAITSPTITGTTAIGSGATLTAPVIAGGTINMGKLSDCTIISPAITNSETPVAKRYALPVITSDTELVTLSANQTLSSKTLTSPIITSPTVTGAAIDKTSTFDGYTLATHLSTKADISEQTTFTAAYEFTTEAESEQTITDNDLLGAAELDSDYAILWNTVNMALYKETTDAHVWKLIPFGRDGNGESLPTATLNTLGNYLSSISLYDLDAHSTYSLTVSFTVWAY
jgi:hypothetical protein